jgi:hypothetical protein
MLFAHLKRILRLDRLRLRGPFGARDEFLLAATAQNLRKLAKLILPPVLKPARLARASPFDLSRTISSPTSSTQSVKDAFENLHTARLLPLAAVVLFAVRARLRKIDPERSSERRLA